jgi:hypothetical protein
MSDIAEFGETRLNGAFKNPFNKQSIVSVSVTTRERLFDLGWISEGTIKFKNGNTEGKQEFIGESFDDVVGQIKTFLNHEL